jgi:positive regulator of sigma E activity
VGNFYTGLIMKLIVCPLAVVAEAEFLPNVNYISLYQPVAVGVVVALAGQLTENLLLRGSLLVNLVADFFVAMTAVYCSQYFFPDTYVTWGGASITAYLVALAAGFTHLFRLEAWNTGKDLW